MKHQITYVQGAEDDLGWYRANEQKLIFDAVMRFLQTDARVESRKRKQLRPNPVAPWELRLGKYRVFYEVAESGVVRVLAVGHKEHNELFIRGERVQL
jgi:mRNA-degrading endonuclease RelE of RelBE toxin-antitoxin system